MTATTTATAAAARFARAASLTVKGRPLKSCSLRPLMAACASESLFISTKPKPLLRPVAKSITTCAFLTAPKGAKSVSRSALVVV